MGQQQYERVSLFREATMAESTPDNYGSRRGSRLQEPKFNYKPWILRTIPLTILFAFAVALIVLLEYAEVHLPHGSGHSAILTSRSTTQNNVFHYQFARANTSIASTISTQSPSAAASAAGSEYLQDTTQTISPTTTATFFAATSGYLQDTIQTITPTSHAGTSTTAQSAYLQNTEQTFTPTSNAITATTTQSAYLENTIQSVSPTLAYSTDPNAYLHDTTKSVIVSTSDEPNVSAIVQTAYLDTSAVTKSVAASPSVYVTTSFTAVVVPDTVSSGTVQSTGHSTGTPAYPQSGLSLVTGSSSVSNGRTTLVPIVLTLTVSITSTPPSSTGSAAASAAPKNTDSQDGGVSSEHGIFFP